LGLQTAIRILGTRAFVPPSMSLPLTIGLLALTVIAALWLSGGAAAATYVLLFAAAAVPGIPLGIVLFGRTHPAAWVGGALIGYGLMQLVLWLVIATGNARIWAFVAAWVVLCASAVLAARALAGSTAIAGRAWSRSDLSALLIVALLAAVLMGITYRNLGRSDDNGTRYYRAYFTADFLWHTALANELGKFSMPPRNPYLAPQPMNYYWTYFLLPATAAQLASGPSDAPKVQAYLKANAVLVGVLMLAALFILVRSATTTVWPALAAVVLTVVAASAEGVYAIADLLTDGRSLTTLRDINVDAVTAWPPFNGLRIDSIPRSLWYTPQHTTAIALGLVALTVALLAGAAARPLAIAGAGLCLGLATTMNPLLGAACSLIYGVCVVADARSGRDWIGAVARHWVAAVPVAGAVLWGVASRVTEGAASALEIGFDGLSRNDPVLTLLLSLGPVLLPALAGVYGGGTDVERRGRLIGVTGIGLGLVLLYFVRISEASWVGFRAGQILQVSIPLLLARTFARLKAVPATAMAAGILIVGFPTTLVDTYNAQDIANRRQGPGFRWTIWVTRPQQEAFDWIRINTKPDEIVQMEPIVRGREHWTLIPSFAGRRMAAGLPISLLPSPEYTKRSEQVRELFATRSVPAARRIAHRLGIAYLYVDSTDAAAYPEGVRKFAEHPSAFEPVFANSEARLYRIHY
jgi:hypothetical protein